MNKKGSIGRRNFIKKSTLGIIGTGILTDSEWAKTKQQDTQIYEDPPLRIQGYRTLGRTGFKVSDLACGSVQDESLMVQMLGTGVNYIDTAEEYPGHHGLVSKVLKKFDRKKIFLTTKLEVKKDKSKEGFLDRAYKALEQLQTEYVDCMMMHMPEKAETLKTEGFHQAMQHLKTEGRVRFVGVSNHGSFWFKDPEETMEKVLLAAADDGRFDVFLMAYNFLQMDQGDRVLEVCKKKNIGVALMKTTPIAKYYVIKTRVEQLEKEGKDVHPLYKQGLIRFKNMLDRAEDFIQKYDLNHPLDIREAAIRFVLENPKIHTVCCTVNNFEEMERILRLTGSKLSSWDRSRLAAYKQGCGQFYCRHACGICEPNCPQHVPVNTIMRYNHYFVAQGREKEAMQKYATIPGVNASVCQDCAGLCEFACPYDVPIQGMLLLAHDQLSLVV